jgi:hypothetical protein
MFMSQGISALNVSARVFVAYSSFQALKSLYNVASKMTNYTRDALHSRIAKPDADDKSTSATLRTWARSKLEVAPAGINDTTASRALFNSVLYAGAAIVTTYVANRYLGTTADVYKAASVAKEVAFGGYDVIQMGVDFVKARM